MTREEVSKEVLSIDTSNILLELATGVGKSKLALDLIKKHNPKSILILIPRLVLKDNWNKEFKKWGMENYFHKVTFCTYVSFPKNANKYDMLIADECHHLSQRCIDAFNPYNYNNIILLSATVKAKQREVFRHIIPNLYCFKKGIKEAIDDNILPDPIVYLLPLTLSYNATETIIERPNKSNIVECSYKDRWKYLKNTNLQVRIKCSQWQYINELNGKINYYKRKAMSNARCKNMWLHYAGERLKKLSEFKEPTIKALLQKFSRIKTLTFCSSIEQTERLGKYCINSKNKESQNYLDKFNTNKINHITSCNMINEGVNLINCKVGIYAVLNSSDTLVKQKLGRILRHKSPVVIIPFYEGTREEEIVKDIMLQDYNPELIRVINNLNKITL